MSQYAKKTCNSCGIRLPQPEMYRVEKEAHVGSSNTGLSKRTMFGAALGNNKSQKAVGKYLFSPSKRTYKRKREVWMCGSCAGVTSGSSIFYNILAWIIIIIFFYMVIGFVNWLT